MKEITNHQEISLKKLEDNSHTIWEVEFAKNVCDIWSIEYDSSLEIVLRDEPNKIKGMIVKPEDEGKRGVPNYYLAEYLADQVLENFDDKGLTGKGFCTSNAIGQIREGVYTND